jgi:hypothetical protein
LRNPKEEVFSMPPTSNTAVRLAAAVAMTTTAVVAAGAPASAAPAAPSAGSTWTLQGDSLRQCVVPNDPRLLYWFVGLEGTWSKTITVGFTDLPAGITEYSPAVIEPGSSDGHNGQAQMPFYRVIGAALGHYEPKLTATDGTVTQSVPIRIDVRSSC